MKTHRELAEQLDLFHSEQHAPGMLFWHPNGWHLFQNIQEHMRRCYRQYGFKEVRTPQLMKKSCGKYQGTWLCMLRICSLVANKVVIKNMR